jgi:hypothetical protein
LRGINPAFLLWQISQIGGMRCFYTEGLFHKNAFSETSASACRYMAAVPSFASQSGYTFTPINFPGNYHTVPKAINNSGQVVGYYEELDLCCYDSEWPYRRAWRGFFWNGTSYRDISVPGSLWTAALSLDDRGHVYGVYYSASTSQESPFTLDVGTGNFTLPDVSWE